MDFFYNALRRGEIDSEKIQKIVTSISELSPDERCYFSFLLGLSTDDLENMKVFLNGLGKDIPKISTSDKGYSSKYMILLVKNLDEHVTREDLEDIFYEYDVVEILMFHKDDEHWAEVTLSSLYEARQLIYDFDRVSLDGKCMEISPKNFEMGDTYVLVEHLEPEVTKKLIFLNFRNVVDVEFHKSKKGVFDGTATLKFSSLARAKNAINVVAENRHMLSLGEITASIKGLGVNGPLEANRYDYGTDEEYDDLVRRSPSPRLEKLDQELDEHREEYYRSKGVI